MPEVLLYLAPAIALLVGGVCGYLLGRRELAVYKQAQTLEHERQLQREAHRGGSCWVRGVLPPEHRG